MTRPIVPLWVALPLAAAAGPVLDAAHPDRGWWILAVPAVALVLVALHGRRFRSGLLVGLVFGGAFYWPHIEWAAVFLGPLPWTALAAVMALWCAGMGGLIALATSWLPQVWNGTAGRLLLAPAVVSGLWTARESIASVWPYGGFSWGRVAFSQSDSPFSTLFAWLGVSGTTFALVFLAAFAVALTREAVSAPRLAVSHATAFVLALLTLLNVPAWTSLPGTDAAPEGAPSSLRIGAVQGNTKAGYFDPPDAFGDNLLGQAEATEPLFGEDVDIVVWPEGASDADPLREGWAAEVWNEVSDRTGAPIVGGTVTARVGPDGEAQYFNTALLWRDGEAVDFYDKKHPVPFGEYVPDRAFWRQFAPDLIDLIQREYTPGTTDAVLEVAPGALAGLAICFDIVDDQLVTEIVEQGGSIVFAVTNNADFGRTDESVQQLAIARIRALETARTVVNISTVGTSAIVLPDGSIAQQLPWYQPGVMVDDVPLRATVTPAVLVGRQLEWLVAVLGLGGLIVAGLNRPRTQKRAEPSAMDVPAR